MGRCPLNTTSLVVIELELELIASSYELVAHAAIMLGEAFGCQPGGLCRAECRRAGR